MSLEVEAERQRPIGPASSKSGIEFSPGVEMLFRLAALGILLVVATFSVYVPFILVAPPWGGLVVVAMMLLWLVSLGGRMHAMGRRVAALEAQLATGLDEPSHAGQDDEE